MKITNEILKTKRQEVRARRHFALSIELQITQEQIAL